MAAFFIECCIPSGTSWGAVDKIYYTLANPDYALRRANLDGSGVETLWPDDGVSGWNHIAVDGVNGNLYVHDGVAKNILMANLDGSGKQVIITSASSVSGISVDVIGGKVYYTLASPDYALRRANLDGSGVETLWPDDGVSGWNHIAVDGANGKLYVHDATTKSILMANLDGSGKQTVITSGSSVNGIAVPSYAGDADGDGIGDNTDNCVNDPNPDQNDANGDGVGDVCDFVSDTDGDGVVDGQEIINGTDPLVPDNVQPTPLNDTTEFVKQVYRDFLNREADQGGLDYWVADIDGGSLTRAQCVESFLISAEFAGNISPVTRLYFAYFLRIPDYDGLMYWIGQYKAGISLSAISEAFAQSAEFVNTYGSLSNSEFVTLVYQNVLERAPDQAGLDYWTNLLDTGFSTRGEVMTGFSESAEYIDASDSKIYVTMTYIGLLRRSPDQAGYDYWVGVMDGGASGLGLIDGFLQSPEYAARF